MIYLHRSNSFTLSIMHLQNRKISQHDSAMGLKKSAAEILEASKVPYIFWYN